MTLAVRTAGDPMTVVRAVKKAIWSVNPEQRFDETVTLEAFMDRLTAKRRFLMSLLTLFGVLGLVIAAAGVYAMLAHRVVERRTRDRRSDGARRDAAGRGAHGAGAGAGAARRWASPSGWAPPGSSAPA